MTILDTFYILFKTNADEVKKGTAEAERATKQFQENIGKTDKQIKDLGISFEDLAKAGAKIFGAYYSAAAIKSEIANTLDFQVAMGRLAKTTGVSADEISAWDAAVQRASGGPAGEFTSWLTKMNDQLISQGNITGAKNLIPNLLELSDKWQGLSVQQKEFYGQQYGLTQDLILLLDQGPDKVKAIVAEQQKMLVSTKEDTDAALELSNAWENVKRSIMGATSALLLHPKDSLKKGLLAVGGDTDTVDWQKTAQYRPTSTIGKWWRKNVLGIDDDEATASGAATPTPPRASAVLEPLGIRNNNPGNLRKWGGVPSIGGFAHFPTLEAGIAAEKKQLQLFGQRGIDTISAIAETFAPRSENDTDAYIANLSKTTGYDANQRLNLNDPAVVANMANAINKIEDGKNYANMISQAKDSMEVASTSPFSAAASLAPRQGTNVHIDSILINTQATDADGIAASINDKLKQHFRYTVGNADDSILF